MQLGSTRLDCNSASRQTPLTSGFWKWTRRVLSCVLAARAIVASPAGAEESKPARPNLLIIVTDDPAYSDLGAFGGEIGTPNLDALALSGVRFTNFEVSPTCSPTRVMLMTGNDNHEAGLGNMAELLTANQRGKRGYEGQVNERVATLAERLRAVGYHTLLSGKWHLGTDRSAWPVNRGFDRSFVLLQGGDNHFGLKTVWHRGANYMEDDRPIPSPTTYSTDYFTANFITLLNESKTKNQPFFGYLAYTAPHWPLQAPDALIQQFKGKYDAGYEALRKSRFERQKALGLIGDVQMGPIYGAKAWSELTDEEKKVESKKMEVYAAMIKGIDNNVGRIVQTLKANGQFENTVIVFLSDNGAAGSAYDRVGTFDDGFGAMVRNNFDNSVDNIGRANSLTWYGPGWGQAGTAPMFTFKIFTGHGGIRSPLFVSGAHFSRGLVNGSLAHVTDVAATLLDLAGAPADGHGLGPAGRLPVEGKSWKSVLEGRSQSIRTADEPVAGELFGGRHITKGDYRAVWLTDMAKNIDARLPTGRWMLFHIKSDPGETTDLAQREPAKLQELVELWNVYARRNGVVLAEGGPVGRIDSSRGQSKAPAPAPAPAH